MIWNVWNLRMDILCVSLLWISTTNSFYHHRFVKRPSFLYTASYDSSYTTQTSLELFIEPTKTFDRISNTSYSVQTNRIVSNAKASKNIQKSIPALPDYENRNKKDSGYDISVYDGEKIQKYGLSNPVTVIQRLIEIGTPIANWYLYKYVDEAVMIPFLSETQKEKRIKLHAKRLKESIVQSKSIALIKSGQALALRPDIVKNRYYINELTKLQDEVGVFDNNIAMNIIKTELNITNPNDIFEFDPIYPIASASIGQVYRAKLRSNNQLVAIKVQRPDAIRTSPIDMFILRNIAGYIRKTKKLRSDLIAIADIFGSQLFNELNYIQEAQNCYRFRSLYGNISGIYVPTVNFNLTTKRVLVMEWVEGIKGPWPNRDDGQRMLTIGLQCSVYQLLGTGYFHSDPHRGNLIKTPSNQLAYIDFGMMSEVKAENRYALIGTVLGMVNKDFDLIIRNLRKLQFFPETSDEKAMVEALTNSVMNAMDNNEGSSLNFTKLSQNIQAVSSTFPIQIPAFYSLIVRTLTILEGLALNVDPSFRLIKGAYPFIMKQILENPSPEMINLLESVLLTKDKKNIRWDKLEQFISIASSANKAIKGNFNAMKLGQERSDILKSLTGNEIKGNVTIDIVYDILNFLLSENGKFLREPLINEIVEILDSIGLATLSFVSIASFGVIPKPYDKPNREQLIQFIKLLETIYNSANIENNRSMDQNRGYSSIENNRIMVSKVSSQILSTTQDLLSRESMESILPILQKATNLFRPIVIRLADRSIRRTVKSITRPIRRSSSTAITKIK